jgi:integrase
MCLSSLYALLARYNHLDAAQAKVISGSTARERRECLIRCVDDLYQAGYHLRDIRNLGGRHVQAIIRAWEARGYSAAVLQKYRSYLATLCRWINKQGMVKDLDQYLADPARARRIRVATEDKSWQARGVTPDAKIEAVMAEDRHVGVCLLLQDAFGLRAKEAWRLRPRLADAGETLHVTHGTKGGRPRHVPIRTDYQRSVLALAKQLANGSTGSMIPSEYSQPSWQAHFYRACRKHGISREQKVVPHGLRHGYANDEYTQKTGQQSPVRGGRPPLDTEKVNDLIARQQVAEALGHGRIQVSSAYLGTFLKPRNHDTTDTSRAAGKAGGADSSTHPAPEGTTP